jgi:hypothetical protein
MGENITQCPYCHSDNTKPYKQVTTAPYLQVSMNDAVLNVAAVTTYSECQDCKIIFNNSPQSKEWYDWFYASGTYRNTLGISQEVMDSDENRRALETIGYINKHNIQPKYHMDIGASRGFLLKLTQRMYNCDVNGDDPNNAYSEMEYDNEARNPDLLKAIHVLEHTLAPVAELRKWSSMTSRWMFIEVPGMNCKGGPLRFAHLYYFPPELLKRMIEDTGMTVIDFDDGDNTRILAEWRK